MRHISGCALTCVLVLSGLSVSHGNIQFRQGRQSRAAPVAFVAAVQSTSAARAPLLKPANPDPNPSASVAQVLHGTGREVARAERPESLLCSQLVWFYRTLPKYQTRTVHTGEGAPVFVCFEGQGQGPPLGVQDGEREDQ